ncbi:MAG: hypothetical protein WCK15_23235 [Pirellula sp.]
MADSQQGLLVAISAGGDDRELAVHGIGMEHVEELMVRMAMRLLSDGHRLAFGGTLGVADKDLTQYLIDTAHRWSDEDSARAVDISRPNTWPLVNYSAWPRYKSITEEQKAKLVGICRFHSIDPPLASQVNKAKETTPAQEKRLEADALTAMRKYSAEQVDFRIVWGGKIKGSSGWIAGILEEVVCTLELNKPLLVLGGFGGCARLIADFLKNDAAEWPEALSLAASADTERDASLSIAERDDLNHRMTHVREVLAKYRKAIHDKDKTTVHGISTTLIQSALTEESTRVAINVVGESASSLKR